MATTAVNVKVPTAAAIDNHITAIRHNRDTPLHTALAFSDLSQVVGSIVQALGSINVAIPNTQVEGYAEISVVAGVGTPNLALGLNQHITLTGDTVITYPTNIAGPGKWTLIVDQDSTGGRVLIMGGDYFGDTSGIVTEPNTRSQINWLIDSQSLISINSIITGNPIPA